MTTSITLEQQINRLLDDNEWSYEDWGFYGFRSNNDHKTPIEKWQWRTQDEARVKSNWSSRFGLNKQESRVLLTILAKSNDQDSIRDLVDQLILAAPLATCLVSPSEYIRARRKLHELLQGDHNAQ